MHRTETPENPSSIESREKHREDKQREVNHEQKFAIPRNPSEGDTETPALRRLETPIP